MLKHQPAFGTLAAIKVHHRNSSCAGLLVGGLLSGALFQYPGAIIMTAIGVFAANQLVNPAGPLAGVASGVQEKQPACRLLHAMQQSPLWLHISTAGHHLQPAPSTTCILLMEAFAPAEQLAHSK